MNMENIFDFDVIYDTDEEETKEAAVKMSASDALVQSMNRYGSINMPFMRTLTGKEVKELIAELSGKGIFQDPVVYDREHSEESGWLLEEQYRSGNLIKNLQDASRLNKKYHGRFSQNVRMLKSFLPQMPSADEIYMGLGATWIPVTYYQEFLKDLFEISANPEVAYIEDLGKWKIIVPVSPNSVKNCMIYGTDRMDAVKIIQNTMNAVPIKVFDTVRSADGSKNDRILNRTETAAAQEKQELILKTFDAWTHLDEKRSAKLQECYCGRYTFGLGQYDGSFLDLSDMNPEVQLYPHQKNAVARIVLTDSVLLAHDVGAGKTYEMAAGAHELKRMGLSEKNMIVVPNNIFPESVKAHRFLYPEDSLLVIAPKDFTPSKRKEMLEKIRTEDHTAIYMAYSSFDMLKMSRQYYIRQLEQKIHKLVADYNASSDFLTRQALKNEHTKLLKELKARKKKLAEHKADILKGIAKPEETECFEKLGITAIFLDEAHNYKNIKLGSRLNDCVVGLNAAGSARSCEMLEKVHFVKRHNGRVVFATGTPLTNSLADLFVIQKYLQPEMLAFCKVDTFEQWLNTFAERENSFEMDVDSSGCRMKTRFSRFHNLPELMTMFSSVCDFYHNTKEEMDLPDFGEYQDISIVRNEDQIRYLDQIVQRTERIRNHEVNPEEDNLLKVTTDGRKCALDVRLVMPESSGLHGKVHDCAQQVAKLAKAYPQDAQLVFCDTSTPKASFNIYDEMKSLLLQKGLGKEEIAFIHDGNTDAKRSAILKKVNQGKIRVLIGSTQKLGTGVNVQERLIAIHHLDIPWRPADMVQREGRLIRTGNMNDHVFIYRYVTEHSFDAYTYQILENKQKFIASFLSGTLEMMHRSESDLSDTVLNYAEIKALAIGNPLIRKRVETANELEKLKFSQREKRKQLLKLQEVVSNYPKRCEQLNMRMAQIKEDMKTYKANKVGMSKDIRIVLGQNLLRELQEQWIYRRERKFCEYMGFSVIIPDYVPSDKPFVQLCSSEAVRYNVSMKDARELGCTTRLDNALEHLDKRLEETVNNFRRLTRDHNASVKELNEGNPFDEQVEAKGRELAAIDEQLL